VRHGKQTECERDENNRKGLEGRHGESALSNLIVKMEKWERDNLYRPPELKRGSLHPAWLVSTSVISFAIACFSANLVVFIPTSFSSGNAI
jgi:hypothetical protein